ncbi:serine O-acetyltransferase [Microcystis aeruginosa]|uniref:serine O-acetyltransferase n=1 Tax=Microcystis aeruginosa TaxID=1126 RepID=UPI00187F049C|nr:serine O-acetyltransferase [Microcystis aeruginosa]MBE8995900.1 serine acetyltransferase [Microcystis aeruginosa LEGE 91341]
MKSFFRKLFFYAGIVLLSPLIIAFQVANNRELILGDVRRWVELLGWEKRADWLQLLALCLEAKEFRNLYYFRLFQGGSFSRFFMYILRFFYRESSYLFLDSSCSIGKGLFIQHGFSTIVMADLGDNCWINQQVTIGYKDKSGRPKIGNNVRITAGAKVLGNITIGDNVTVGANSVVVKDVPPNCVVVGIPARIVKRDGVKVDEKL